MLEIPLKVITKPIENIKKTSLKEIIKERKLLKTKLKLIQIYYIDKDLQTLDKYNLTLKDITLDDIYLTEPCLLYVPLKDKIIYKESNNHIKLKSYLIYLSYLYNFNFLDIYYKNPLQLYPIILNLNISKKIKLNLYNLLNNTKGEYFSECIEDLNNIEFRENLYKDELKLTKM